MPPYSTCPYINFHYLIPGLRLSVRITATPTFRRAMHARCTKFWEDGQYLLQISDQAKSKDQIIIKICKELRTLSRFLQKNQSSRFDDTAQTRLLDAIAIYIAFGKQQSCSSCLNYPSLIEGLSNVVNDALAMPFNVISTKQKKKLLKWHEDLTGLTEYETDIQKHVTTRNWTVLAVDDDGYFSLLNEDTDEVQEHVAFSNSFEKLNQIRSAITHATVTVTVAGECIMDVRIEED